MLSAFFDAGLCNMAGFYLYGMSTPSLPEVWLRGPIAGVSPFLQPVAHALLQAKEEITMLMEDFPEDRLWDRPAGLASPGFHLQHLVGVLDRLLTYAEGRSLSADQLAYLKSEGESEGEGITTAALVTAFAEKIDAVVASLKAWNEDELKAARAVGRAQLPSTVLGLLFHAAEHTMRHTGQLLVTVRVLTASR